MADNREKELKQLLGRDVVPLSATLAPAKPVPPKPAPGGIESPFPIVPMTDLHKYQNEPKRAEDPVANNQPGVYDKDLNEAMLRDIARERGLTLDQLLASPPDRKLERKVEAMPGSDQVLTPEQLVAMQKASQAAAAAAPQKSIADLEAEIARLKQEALALDKPAAPVFKSMEAEKPKKSLDTPVLRRMRERLSLERLQPGTVEIEGIVFSFLPPPSSLHAWVLGRLIDARPFGQDAFKQALQHATAASSVVSIDGQTVPEALGLSAPGQYPDFRKLPREIRELAAQTLFEIFDGNPTVEHLQGFQANPDLGKKIAQAFEATFDHIDLQSSLDPQIRTWVCEMEGCTEQYDLKKLENDPVFCKQHGTPMTHRGLSAEVRRGPLP